MLEIGDVGGIKENEGDFRQQPGAPEFEFDSLESAGFETVGLSVPGRAALVGADLEVTGAFEDHGGVGEHFGDERYAFKSTV